MGDISDEDCCSDQDRLLTEQAAEMAGVRTMPRAFGPERLSGHKRSLSLSRGVYALLARGPRRDTEAVHVEMGDDEKGRHERLVAVGHAWTSGVSPDRGRHSAIRPAPGP